MFIMDLKSRIKNPVWWISLVGAIAIIASYFGYDITKIVGQDWKGLIGAIFSLLTILGITADTSTKGISDKVIQDATVQAINNDNGTKEAVQTEATTTSINNKINPNSEEVTVGIDGPQNTSNLSINDGSVNASVQANELKVPLDATALEQIALKAVQDVLTRQA